MCAIKRNYQKIVGLLVFFVVILITTIGFGVTAEAEMTADSLPGEWITLPDGMEWGLIYDETNAQASTQTAVASNEGNSYSDLPTSVNLSATKYFPPIRSQGENVSCSAWSTTYYQYTYEVAKLQSNNWDTKHDDSKVFSPKYVWNYLNGGENEEISRNACYGFLSNQGSVSWSTFPQNDTGLDWDNSTTNELMSALSFRADIPNSQTVTISTNGENTFVTSYNDADLNLIKYYLSQGHVLTFDTFTCNWRVSNQLNNGQYGIISATEEYRTEIENGVETTKLVGHAMTIVGYNDNVAFDYNGNLVYDDNEKGAFLLANSWGPNADQHNDGYIWLMYDALNASSNFTTGIYNYNLKSQEGWERKQFINNNECYALAVKNVQPELMVEVTLGQEVRNDIEVSLSRYQQYNPGMKIDRPTFLSGVGGPLDFGGSSENAYGTRTFLFDYGDLYIGENYEYQVTIKDRVAGNSATNILSVRWLDANGNVIRQLGNQGSVNGIEKTFSWDDHGDGFGLATPIALHSNSDGVGAIERVGDNDIFKFIPSTTGKYLFYTIGDLDTMGYLYDDEGEEVLTSGDDEWLEGNNFALTQTLTAGQTYYIEVTAYGTNTGSYTLLVCKDFYSSALASTNQDARRVQMQFETSPIYNHLQLRFRNTDYFINKPTANYFERTYSDGTKIRATVSPSGNGLSMVWYLQIKMSPTSVGMTDSFAATFTTNYLSDELENTLTGLVAYDSSVVTGVSEKSANSLQLLVNSLTTTGHSLTVYNWDNSEVLVTSTIKAATGMKIVKRNSSNQIVEVFYVVVYGDVTGAGDVNLLGNGDIGADDAMEILKETVGKVEFVGLATIAADADHDGEVGSNDALEINKDVVGKTTINQNVAVTTVPDDCYFLTPVIFA